MNQKDTNTVLIIEDNALQRKTVSVILKSRGYKVIEAEDGNQCFSLIKSNMPDIILLDINLPGIDGYTVCRRLKHNEETKDIPVIMVTSMDNIQDRIDGLDVGAQDFLTKPFNSEELIIRIKSTIEMNRVTKELRQKNENLEKIIIQLKEESRTDELTGLLNRRRIFEVFDYELIRAARYKIPISYGIIDIDHFKRVNDNYGHPVGDIILKQIAHIIQNNIRVVDYSGRIGGEEFLLIFPHTPLDEAMIVAERLRKVTEKTNFVPVGSITISLGIGGMEKVNLKDETASRDNVIKSIDEALYRAKQGGRNKVCKERNK